MQKVELFEFDLLRLTVRDGIGDLGKLAPRLAGMED
jgi:hypothetical protein